tara:strand:+ start:8856 stop:9332 length:477 start_codon:yes stop_codon:yes gene_type:complete
VPQRKTARRTALLIDIFPFAVGLFSFVFVLDFGDYPSWQAEERNNTFQRYLRVADPHLVFHGFVNPGNGRVSLMLHYRDGFQPENSNYKRPNHDSLAAQYKPIVLQAVCSYPDFYLSLQKGTWKNIEVNVLDGDLSPSMHYLFNLQINYQRCQRAPNV